MKPRKNWALVVIIDHETAARQCQNCGTWIRYEYRLVQDDDHLSVGSECVKSFIDTADPDTALQLWKGQWTQRRHYYYKRARGVAWILGRKAGGFWWVATARSVRAIPWEFFKERFLTDVLA